MALESENGINSGPSGCNEASKGVDNVTDIQDYVDEKGLEETLVYMEAQISQARNTIDFCEMIIKGLRSK